MTRAQHRWARFYKLPSVVRAARTKPRTTTKTFCKSYPAVQRKRTLKIWDSRSATPLPPHKNRAKILSKRRLLKLKRSQAVTSSRLQSYSPTCKRRTSCALRSKTGKSIKKSKMHRSMATVKLTKMHKKLPRNPPLYPRKQVRLGRVLRSRLAMHLLQFGIRWYRVLPWLLPRLPTA